MIYSTDRIITFVCYNIGLGGRYLRKIIDNFSQNKDLSRADIICLQESSSINDKLDSQVIAEKLGQDYESTNVEAQKVFGVMQANAIIYNRKKFDLISSEVLQLPSLPTYMYFLYLPLVGKAKFDQRSCLIQTFIYKGKIIRVYNTQLDVRGGWKLKEEQIKAVLERVDSLKKAHLEIICGDLNTANILPERFSNKERFLRKLKWLLARRDFFDASSEVKWTFQIRYINPRARYFKPLRLLEKLGININVKRKVDFIFVRANRKYFKIDEPAYTLEVGGSDHLPLVLRVKTSV